MAHRPALVPPHLVKLALMSWACVSWARASTAIPSTRVVNPATPDVEGLGRRQRHWRKYIHLFWVYMFLRHLGPGYRGDVVKWREVPTLLGLLGLLSVVDEVMILLPLRLSTLHDMKWLVGKGEAGRDLGDEDCTICFGTERPEDTEGARIERYCTKSDRHVAHPTCFLTWCESATVMGSPVERQDGEMGMGVPCPVCRGTTSFRSERAWRRQQGDLLRWVARSLGAMSGGGCMGRGMELMSWSAGVMLSTWIGGKIGRKRQMRC